MKTLAIDTSTNAQCLALTQGPELVARRLSFPRPNHSATLLSNIDDMLEQAGWRPTELELVAVGLGPGTFTGLRTGLATAKAIARSAQAAIVGISSLAATARPLTALFDGTIVAVCDARRGEVYCATFRADGGRLHSLTPATARTPTAVRALVESTSGPVVLVGSGLRAFSELTDWAREDIRVMAPPWDPPSSVSLALLAAERLATGGADDLAALEPDYVRPSDAEIHLQERG